MLQSSYTFGDRAILSLRSLYDSYGYTQYKMSKFEEYDLYARNKDFLISDSIITFTDTNGKLMALKPDVTLSIVKNTKDTPASVQKLYYHENVYRVSGGTRSFKEIMQIGLECIGDIGAYELSEVMLLAAKSLREISHRSILDISHLGLVSAFLDTIGVPAEKKPFVFKCIGEKNRHEMKKLCAECAVSPDDIAALCSLISVSGSAADALPQVLKIMDGRADSELLNRFASVLSALSQSPLADALRIDFSVVDDVHYYNGFVFKGFVEGVPSSVLSGGQYDRLMQKMGRTSGAIGFAVYMDALERLGGQAQEYDVDIVLLYDENERLEDVQSAVQNLIDAGSSVLAARNTPDQIKFRRLIQMQNGEIKEMEHHA